MNIGAGSRVEFENSKTNCPLCGFKEARIPDGLYQANTTAIQVLLSPGNSQELIEAFQKLARRVATGQISSDQGIKEAGSLSPRFAEVMEKFAKLGLPGLALLLAIVTLYLQYEGNKSSSEALNNILTAITEQTLVLRDCCYVQQKSVAAVRHSFGRRAEVNKQRRIALKVRRQFFGRARRH